MKEKILYLSPQNPYPPVDGGKIGIYYPIRYLSKYFEVILVFVASKDKSKVEINETIYHFNKLGIKAFPIYKNTKGFNIDLKYLLINIFRDVPFKWDKYYSINIMRLIRKIIYENNIDKVFVSSPHMARYCIEAKKEFPKLKTLLREHNLEFKLAEQYYKSDVNYIYKKIALWQYKKAKKQEIKYWNFFDKVLFISDNDFTIANKLATEDSDKFYVFYDGYEITCDNTLSFKHINDGIIFPANLQTLQNEFSFRWFIDKIWLPSLDLIKNNKIRLYVSGNEDKELRKFFGKYFHNSEYEKLSVFNVGFTNDINKEILKYKYVLSPTIIGSGIRLKVLNGMACGKCVFATPLDIETTKEFKDLYNIVCFDSANEFFNKYFLLENNDELYQLICKNAFNTIKEKFSWSRYVDNIIKVLNNTNN